LLHRRAARHVHQAGDGVQAVGAEPAAAVACGADAGGPGSRKDAQPRIARGAVEAARPEGGQARLLRYLSRFSSAATPGNSIPARNSSDAPPPVEMWLILSATPAELMAFSESPPPTTLMAPESATAFARATVPLSNGGVSNTPIGPFQITVFAPRMT